MRLQLLIAVLACSPLYAATYHATLLRSRPAANSRLERAPDSVRLVFSEAVVADLSQIALIDSDGKTTQLSVASDPHDVHVLVAAIPAGSFRAVCIGTPCLARHRVSWRVLSADGHPVAGVFLFSIIGRANAAPADSGPVSTIKADQTPISMSRGAEEANTAVEATETVPLFAALLRGVGLGALMGGIGLLVLGSRRESMVTGRLRRLVSRLVLVGTALLVAHLIAWLFRIAPDQKLGAAVFSAAMESRVGQMELLRVVLAILSAWAIGIARSEKLALVFGMACLLVSGALGHPAALMPAWTIPAKMIHLVTGSLWLGALLWLTWIYRREPGAFATEAARVSRISLLSVFAVLLSGLIQTRFFLNTPPELWETAYGRLVLAKVGGLFVLILFGAYHRYRLMPNLAAAGSAQRLSQSLTREILVMTLLILIGGFLAYVPTPPVPTLRTSSLERVR